jgi:hypothetical protein
MALITLGLLMLALESDGRRRHLMLVGVIACLGLQTGWWIS